MPSSNGQDSGDGKDAAAVTETTTGPSHWACHACSYQNPGSEVKSCQICFVARLITPPDTAAASVDSGDHNSRKEWSCTKCTFLNKVESSTCAICKERNPSRQKPQLWHCPQCTYSNAVTAVQCEVCFYKRNGANVDTAKRSSTMAAAASTRPVLLPLKQESEYMEALRAIDEVESNEQYQNILLFCRQNRQPFVDDSFPPAASSLRRNGNTNYTRRLPQVGWRRPARVTNFLERVLFPWTVCNSPIPSDIVQGILGNCWFLSALAVVAERRDILDRVLITKQISPEGAYQIRLYIDGSSRVIVVDDLFPCAPNGAMIYSKAKRNQLWVPLIEKALAKAYGSYEALSAGRTIEGLAILTGAPCEALLLPGSGRRDGRDVDTDVVWAQLLSMKDAKFLLGASCGGDQEGSAAEYNLLGLEPLHAYSLLDVREVHGARLVKCRNPWGHFSWNGAWSEHSSLWTPQLRAELMPEGFRDGIFWMPYEDFCRYFDTIDICRYRNNWKELRLAGLLPPHCRKNFVYVAEVATAEATEIDIALYQPNTRNEKPSKHGVLDLGLMLFSVDEFGRPSRLVARSGHGIRSFVTLTSLVQPGQYIVVWVAFNHWGMQLTDEEIPKCVLAMHSARSITAQVRSVNPVLIADCMIRMLLQDAITTGTDIPGVTVYYLTKKWTGVVVMVANYNADAVLQVHCDCSESQNAVSTRGTLVTMDTVPPMHRQIIMVLTQVEGSAACSFCYRVQYTLLPTVRGNRPYQDVISYANRILSFLGSHNQQLTEDSGHQAPTQTNHNPELDADVYGLHAPRPI